MRIVSLLPAATELVHALGLGDVLVGRSHECDTPVSVAELPVVTRAEIDERLSSGEIDRLVREFARDGRPLYRIDDALLKRLRPDVIVTQELCDVCAITPGQVDEAIRGLEPRPRVVRLGPGGLDDVLDDLVRLGRATGRVEQAEACRRRLERRIAELTVEASVSPRPRVLFLEWLDPAFGAGHWNPELIERAGGQSVLDVRPGDHSRTIDDDTLDRVCPELIFVAACGFTAERARREWDALDDDHPVRRVHRRSGARLHFADGNAYFNRPGPRLVDSLEVLAAAVRPGAVTYASESPTHVSHA
ncbi:MAG: ABC transporter substrate-binding protein [Planctomycetota bacterium]